MNLLTVTNCHHFLVTLTVVISLYSYCIYKYRERGIYIYTTPLTQMTRGLFIFPSEGGVKIEGEKSSKVVSRFLSSFSFSAKCHQNLVTVSDT